MAQRRREHREQLRDRLRAAGQVDDQRAPGDPRDPAREHPHRRVRQRRGPQRLGEPRRLALDHGARRLRRHVVGREAGAAGREDERDAVADVAAQHRLDRREVVGHDLSCDDLAAGLGRESCELRAGGVVALAARERRGDREDGGLHGSRAYATAGAATPRAASRPSVRRTSPAARPARSRRPSPAP